MPAGTTTALVGETGSGKTTLGYLVARLYDVTRGKITIGGADIRDLSFKALSDLVGVVSQETYLFHATVRENLRFAKPDATDAEIEAAADAARIHNVIAALPDGYDTVVGERGYRFSGGEKQRMAIARTVLRNPPILVLDEATSSLDTETERLVQEALDRLAEGRTTIAIAHRLSTVRDADQIVVLDHGTHRRARAATTTSSSPADATRRWPHATRCSPTAPVASLAAATLTAGPAKPAPRAYCLHPFSDYRFLRRPPTDDQRVEHDDRQQEARQRPQRIRLDRRRTRAVRRS